MATLYYRPYTSQPVQDGPGEGLPPHNAMESILPDYQYIFVDPDPRKQPPRAYVPDGKMPEDLDKSGLHLVDYQMHELEKYRTAVQKMGQDILTLREEIRDLESNNSNLRRDLSKYNDVTKLLMDSQDLDGLTKPELAARYVALKQKLTSQTSDLRGYKERVQQLQNDLIKQNEQEKDYLKMSHAHASQNEHLQNLQKKAQKVRKLEETCRKQEKNLERMERLLANKNISRDTRREPDAANEALLEENQKLRSELDDLRDQNRLLHRGRGLDAEDMSEKLQMLEKQERSEGRIISLEKQLSENARKWGREKSDLMTKLQEAELGLRRTSTLPSKMTHSYAYEPQLPDSRRFSKAPPSRRSKGLVGSSKLDPFSY